MQLRSFFLFGAALLACATIHAQDLRVHQAQARATAPHQPSGAVYLTMENTGKAGDKLLGASSPVARSVEVHTMKMEGNVMRMREVPALELPAGSRLEMKPGDGYHLMLLGLRQPLKAGDSFPVTLRFEKSGKMEVTVSVQDKSAAGHRGGHGH